MTTQGENIATLIEQNKNLQRTVDEIKKALEDDYVTKNEFNPIKSIVYGFVGIILTTVAGAVLWAIGIRKS